MFSPKIKSTYCSNNNSKINYCNSNIKNRAYEIYLIKADEMSAKNHTCHFFYFVIAEFLSNYYTSYYKIFNNDKYYSYIFF